MRTSSKAAAKTAWLQAFAEQLTAKRPTLAGRIEWDDAHHFFYSGYTPADAVARYVASRDVMTPVPKFLHQP